MLNALEPIDHLEELVPQINGLMKDADFQFSSILNYIEAEKKNLSSSEAKEQPQFLKIGGELRSFQEHCVLSGVLSSRIWIKQRNDNIQKTLTRWAEPYSSINWMLFAGGLGGAEGPALPDGFADVPPHSGGIAPRTTGRANEYPQNYLSLAWEYLLQNQCQDNIGGCSVDEVHRQMVYRFDFAEDIANLLKDRSLSRIGDLINTTSFEENGFGLAVFKEG